MLLNMNIKKDYPIYEVVFQNIQQGVIIIFLPL